MDAHFRIARARQSAVHRRGDGGEVFSRGITAAYFAGTLVVAALAVLQFAILRRWQPADAP